MTPEEHLPDEVHAGLEENGERLLWAGGFVEGREWDGFLVGRRNEALAGDRDWYVYINPAFESGRFFEPIADLESALSLLGRVLRFGSVRDPGQAELPLFTDGGTEIEDADSERRFYR